MLKDFYYNVELRKAVQVYLVEYLKEVAVEKVFNREDTSAVAEAKELVDKAFDNLEVMYSKPRKNTESEEAV